MLVHPNMADRVPAGTVAIVTPEPYLGWAKVAALFHPRRPRSPGVHPSCRGRSRSAIGAPVGGGRAAGGGRRRAEIGAACRIGPGAVIGAGVQMGPHCRVGPLASISHAVLGARVYVYPGARIGQEGFRLSQWGRPVS